MAIETGARLPPLAAIRNELAKLRSSAMVRMSGHAPTVDMVDAWLVSIDARVASLETQVKQLQGMGGAVDEFARHITQRFQEGS